MLVGCQLFCPQQFSRLCYKRLRQVEFLDTAESSEKMSQSKIVIQGIPYDQSSSFLPGCSQGPAAIRAAFHSDSGNAFTEDGIDLSKPGIIQDAGDISLTDNPISQIEEQTRDLLDGKSCLLSLGGDHFVTYPILKAFAAKYGKVHLVQFDAHPDLYEELDGNRQSHACPFARSHEAGLIDRHLQIGIRTMTSHQQEQADRFGVEVLPVYQEPLAIDWEGPVYITLDLDVLDPAFAPGISHYEPGGLSVRQVLDWLQMISVPVVGADIVELNPTRDLNGMTATVAAKFLKELAALMLRNT